MIRMIGLCVLASCCLCVSVTPGQAQRAKLQEVEYIPVSQVPENRTTKPRQLSQQVPYHPTETITYPQEMMVDYSEVEYIELPNGELAEYRPNGNYVPFSRSSFEHTSKKAQPDPYEYPRKGIWALPQHNYPQTQRVSHRVPLTAPKVAPKCRPGYALCPTSECESCVRPHGHCLKRLWDWISFCPTRTCACSGRTCNWSVHPPMYYYFLNEHPSRSGCHSCATVPH